jgi:general secretion pathway protein J
MRPPRRGDRGFTLLELLIALSIVAALLTIAFGGLRVGLAAWRQGDARADAHQHVRGVALAIARVVAGAYPYTAPRGEAPDPDILFRGTERRLELVTQAPPGAFATPIAFAAVVIELAEGEKPGLVVRQRALPNREPFTDATVVYHDPTVTSLAVAYLDADGGWRDTWEAETEKGLPRAVRLTVGTGADGREETLPPMTITLRVLTP